MSTTQNPLIRSARAAHADAQADLERLRMWPAQGYGDPAGYAARLEDAQQRVDRAKTTLDHARVVDHLSFMEQLTTGSAVAGDDAGRQRATEAARRLFESGSVCAAIADTSPFTPKPPEVAAARDETTAAVERAGDAVRARDTGRWAGLRERFRGSARDDVAVSEG